MEWQEKNLVLYEVAQTDSMIEQLKQIMAGLAMPREKQLDLQLCMLEAVQNGLVHGNGLRQDKWVHVLWRYRDGEFFFSVEDQGQGFQPAAVQPEREENLLAEHGRGLMLLEMLLDKMWYNEQGNIIYGQLSWPKESGGEEKDEAGFGGNGAGI